MLVAKVVEREATLEHRLDHILHARRLIVQKSGAAVVEIDADKVVCHSAVARRVL